MILCSGSRDGGINDNTGQKDGDEVRAPLPVRREVLYDDAVLFPYVLLRPHPLGPVYCW